MRPTRKTHARMSFRSTRRPAPPSHADHPTPTTARQPNMAAPSPPPTSDLSTPPLPLDVWLAILSSDRVPYAALACKLRRLSRAWARLLTAVPTLAERTFVGAPDDERIAAVLAGDGAAAGRSSFTRCLSASGGRAQRRTASCASPTWSRRTTRRRRRP